MRYPGCPTSPRRLLALPLLSAALVLAGPEVGGYAEAQAQNVVDQVIPVPYRPHDPKIPHYAYNYHPTTFKAISRGGCAAGYTDEVYFRWHFDNSGIGGTCAGRTLAIDKAQGKWYKGSRYNLGCRYQIPYVDPNVTPKKLFVGTVEVACLNQVNTTTGAVTVDASTGQPNSKRGSYYVTVFAQVPVGRPANAAGRYAYSARPIPSGTPTCTNGTCANMPSANNATASITCDAGRHDQCVGDTDDDLAVKRAVLVDDSLWYLHTQIVRNSADNIASLSANMPTDCDYGYCSMETQRSVASASAALWGMVQNGYAGAYPVSRVIKDDGSITYTQTYDHDATPGNGIQAHPDATWVSNNIMHWFNSPYAEDVVRLFNHLLANARGDAITDGIDDGNTYPNTADDKGIWWWPHDHTTYFAGPALGALATSGMGTTVAQVSCAAGAGTDLCLGRKIEYIVQQAVDGTCNRQGRYGKNHSWDGSWTYVGPGQADLSTAQWMVIGLEAAEQAMKDLGVKVPSNCKERMPNLLWFSSMHTAGDTFGSGRYRNWTACTNGCSLGETAQDPHLTGGLLVGHGWLGSDTWATSNGNYVWSTNDYSDRTKGEMRERYNAAMTFLGKYWYTQQGGTCWNGSLFHNPNTRFNGSADGYLYALYSIMKGLRTLSTAPTTLNVDTNGDRVLDMNIDWWRDFTYYLVNNQHEDGYNKQVTAGVSSAGQQAGTILSTSWGGVLTATSTVFDPDPVAVAEAVSTTTVDEGCQGAAFGKVTFQHKDSYHLNPKRQIVEYEWLFQTVAAPTNATFEAVPWSSLALDTYYTAHPTNPATKIYAFRTASRDMAPVWQYLNTGTYHAALRVKDNSVDADNNPAPKFNIYSIKNIVVNPQPALAPTANAHGPYEVIEGDGLPLAGEIGDPNLLCRADALTPKWYIPTATARPAIGLTGTAPWLGVLDSIPQRNTPVEIKLEVTDSTGKTATSTTTVKIWDRDFHPCFDLTPSPEVGCNGTVQVDASCTTHPHTGTGFKTFEWQCDNSKAYDAVGFTFTAQSIGKTANCTYKIPGTYYLTLRVTDDYDTVMYTQQQVVMSSSSSPQANAGPAYTLDTWQDQYWAGEDSRQGGFFTLNGSGSVDPDAACGDAIVRWEWDLNEDGIADDLDGDGIPPAQDPDDVVAQPKVTWANLYKLFQAKGWGRERYIANPATGLLNVRVGLKVTDKFGKTGTASSSLTIYHSGPYGVFTANPNPAACGDSAPPVTLDASRSWHGHPTRLITQYAWVFDMPEAVAGADPALILAKFNERVDTQGVSVQHVYPEFGTYHPVLRVTDAQGKTALAFGTPVVVSQGNAAPLVDIGGPYEWSVGGLLQLDARGTIDPNEACGDAAVTFEWDLDGDGQYGEPSAVEGKAGEPVGEAPILQWAQVSHWIPAASWPAAPPTWEPRWTVGLRVTDANGASSTATTEIPIYALTPVAVADWTPKPVVPIDPASGKALVKLDGSWSSTSDPSRTIIQWSWKLGAGTQTTTGEKAQLLVDLGADRAIWEVPGGRVTRDISLRVTDSGNSTADDLITVTFGILASTPAVIQFADDQLAIQVLDPLKVSASATPAAGTTIDYVGWDMNGDGVDERTWVRGVNGQDPTVALKLNLTWAQLLQLYPALTSLGDHEIRLTVKDSLGTPSQDSVKLTVLEKALRAVIRYEPSEGGCSTLFTFDGSGSESLIGSEIVKYTWNYGDGTPSGSTASVVHVFNRFATNTVTLTVEDLADPPHSATTSVSISTTDGNIPPVVKPNGPYFIDADVFSQDANARLTLTGAGTTDPDSGCGDAPAVYRWDLDGVLDAEGHRTWEIETTTVTATVSWAQVLLWKLPQGDLNHRIYLEVEDEQGGTSTAWTTLLIGSGRPVAMFRASPEIAMCGEPVSFDATQSYHPMAPLKTITSYLWDFDYVAANGFVASPLHVNEVQFRQTLPRVGQVKVALRVADADGKSSLFVLPIDVSGDNKAPIARAKPVVAAVGEGVLLDATLSSDPNEGCGDAIVSYKWDLGNDGGTEPWDFTTSTPTLQLTKEQVAAFNFPITDPFTRLPVTIGKLRVQDVGGLQHEANVEIRYYQVTPVAKAVVQPATAGCKVEMVFDGSASYHNHPERSIKRYIWDFDATKNTDNGDWDGDGQDTAWDDNDGEGVQYRYSQYRVKKVYDARLIVWDNVTKSLAKKDSKPIEGNPPTLAFENQKPIANPGGPYLTTVASDNSIPVNLDGTASSDPNVPCDSLVTYWWDTDDDGCFGEEDVLNVVTAGKPQCGTAATAGSVLCGAKDCTDATKSGSNPNWRVGQSYVVALKVKDSYGLWSDEAETTITIAEYVPPTVQIVKPNGGEVFGKSRNVELKVSHPKSQQARLKVWVNSVLLTAAAGQLQATSPTPVSVNIPFDTTAFESKTEFYRVKVVAELASDASIFSTVLSAGPFTIDNLGPTITVTPPDKTGANGYQQTDSLGALVDVQVDVDDQDSLPVVTYKLNNTAVASFPRRLPLGLNKLEVTAKDWLLPTPNSSTLTRFIEVIDTQQPTLFPGPNVVMEADGANGRTQVDLRPSASDICDSAVATKITSNAPPDGFPVGTTPVQFSVTDAKGNTASAEITVTIEDHKPPYFSQIPDDFSVEQSAPEGAPSSVLVEQGLVPEPIYADLGYATADLSCGLFVTLEDADGHDVPPPVGGYPCLPPECLMPKAIGVGVCPEWLPPGTFFPVGITPLTYTVTDPGGQSSSIEVLVTVIGAAPSVTVISRPDSSKWLNCAVDSCTVKFSVANGDPAKPVVVQPLPAGQQQPLPDANGVYTVTYAADGVYLVRVSVWDKAGIEYMFQVPRFNIDTSPPTLQISDFQQAGVVLDDPDTWPLFFRGEEAAPRFTARDELSGLSRVQVTAAPGLEAGGAVVILDRVQPQPLPGTPPTGVRFLGNLACSDQLGLCQGGKLFLGGMKTGEQQLVVEAWDGNDNHGTTAFPYRLISLAEALVIVRGRIADYLAAEPGAGAVTLLTQMDGFLATGQKSLARGYLGGALVSVYDSVTLMLGAALKLVAPADLVAQLKQDAQLLARGCYAETYLYWKLNAVGTAEEQTAYIALMQAWEFIWEDGIYDAAVLKVSNAYFYARNGKVPFRATDIPLSIDVIHRIMAELSEYAQYRELPAVEEVDELIVDMDSRVLWRFENLQNPGWLPAEEFMELLLDLQDMANKMFMAQSKGCWVRNWQWGFAQAIRVVIDVAKADAEGHIPPGHAQYCKIQEAQVQYDLGMGYLDNREPDLMLDLYANWSKGIRCLMLEIYHHAGYQPAFPVENWGCTLEGCTPQGQN